MVSLGQDLVQQQSSGNFGALMLVIGIVGAMAVITAFRYEIADRIAAVRQWLKKGE